MTRSIAGFAAALVAVCCIFFGLASADDKGPSMNSCGYCKAVKDVTAHMRCEACAKADKPCDKCAAMAKKVATTAACPPCKEGKGGCTECSAVMKEKGHCEFCAEKKAVADRSYCCNSCAGAKNADCPECKKVREAVMAIPCEECAKADKGHEGK